MRKRLLLALSLVAVAALLPRPRAEAGGTVSCPQCVTYADGSQCCVSCICTASGIPIACSQNYCFPPDGEF